MKINPFHALHPVSASVVLALLISSAAVTAVEPAASGAAPKSQAVSASAPARPAWLSEFSFGLKEVYDDNVFLSGVAGELRERGSWITTVAPKVGLNFLPLLPEQKTLKTFSFSYAPEFMTFHDEPTETHNDHRIAVALKGKSDSFSFSLDNAFVYIDGDQAGPTYTNGLNAYATATARERREQFQNRANVTLQWDRENLFVRLVSSLLYYELLTDQRTTAGYQNYVDRYDVNGGVDLGYKINTQLCTTLGYRYGHQYQELVVGNALSSSADYQRVLLGVEGKPWKWLTVALVGGPDFRSYAATAPVNDRSSIKYYGEASLTAQPTAKDTIAFKYKQFQWVASTGKAPYLDSAFTLSYNRKLTSKLLFDLSGRILSSDYTSGQTAIGGPTNKRNDWMYTAATGLACTFSPNLSATLAYSIDFGRNQQEGLTAAAENQREFQRQLISLGISLKL